MKPKASSKRQPKKPKKREVKNDYRYLEIVKLLKTYKPVTINGVSVKGILEKAEVAVEEVVETELDGEVAAPRQLLTKNPISDPIHQFIAKFIDEGSPIYLLLMFPPSDPEFPYDLDILKISLCVPPKYPYDNQIQPSIYVLNDDIPRGFAVNIEIGFREITALAASKNNISDMTAEMEGITFAKGRGLLSQIQTLDKNLEYFLKQERRETVKFVKGKKSKSSTPQKTTPISTPSETPVTTRSSTPVPVKVPKKTATSNPVRENSMDSLTSKIPTKLFTKNDREYIYKVELPITSSSVTPPKAWVTNKKVDIMLHIPTAYPEEEAWLKIPTQMLNKITPRQTSISATPAQLEESAREALQERLELTRAAKQFERNFKAVPKIISSAKDDLVTLVNFAASNFGTLCLSEKECNEVFTMLK